MDTTDLFEQLAGIFNPNNSSHSQVIPTSIPSSSAKHTDTVLVLQEAIDKLKSWKHQSRSCYKDGYNTGLLEAIFLLEQKIKEIKGE